MSVHQFVGLSICLCTYLSARPSFYPYFHLSACLFVYLSVCLSVCQTARLSDYLSVSKTSFEKYCFSAWASTLNMGLINKVDMVCLSPVGYGV